jgi:hypothetical protein
MDEPTEEEIEFEEYTLEEIMILAKAVREALRQNIPNK